MMYFKDNKLISKVRYQAAKGRTRKGTTKRSKRSPARRTKSNGVRRMKKSIPHPSVTGMASGLAIAAYLNAGQATTTATGTSLGNVTVMSDGVIKDIADGQLGAAFNTLSGNAINMIASDAGRKTLVTAGGIAALGAFARRQFPQLKLGGSKLYFRL
jgi:hypothetical protein